jgi:hypothetical protein
MPQRAGLHPHLIKCAVNRSNLAADDENATPGSIKEADRLRQTVLYDSAMFDSLFGDRSARQTV